MESTRLPGKVLLDLAGEPLLKRVFERLVQAATVNQVVLALPDTPENDELETVCLGWGARVYRGALDDVLGRYHGAALEAQADVVVRVTSDCPFCDPEVVDRVVSELEAGCCDYVSNNLRRTYPLGLDVEAFRFDVLDRAFRDAIEPHEREHVTPYIYQHPELFSLGNVEAAEWARRTYRLTVDEPNDLELARQVYQQLDPLGSRLSDVIGFLDAHPEYASINSEVKNKDVWRPDSW